MTSTPGSIFTLNNTQGSIKAVLSGPLRCSIGHVLLNYRAVSFNLYICEVITHLVNIGLLQLQDTHPYNTRHQEQS